MNMHNRQDKIWMTSTPSGEEIGKAFRHSFLESPQPMDIWQQKQFEQLAVQRKTYTFNEYIDVINSYWYKELCIFKPHGVVHYAMKAIHKHQMEMQKMDPILMWHKLREPNVTKLPYADMDSFSQYSVDDLHPVNAKYIINHTQRHPFYERNLQNKKQVDNAIYNYEVAQRIKTGDEDKIKSLLRAYMFNGNVSLSTLNQSRLKLLGIELTYTGMDLGSDTYARQQQKSQQFMQRYGNPLSYNPNP